MTLVTVLITTITSHAEVDAMTASEPTSMLVRAASELLWQLTQTHSHSQCITHLPFHLLIRHCSLWVIVHSDYCQSVNVYNCSS